MKKLKLNLLLVAVVLGLAGAIATKAANHKAGSNEYWFEYNNAGTALIDPTTLPPNQVSDPYNCPGSTTNCAASYPAVTLSGGHYYPSGTQIALDKKD